MDLKDNIAQLRVALELIDDAIRSLERLENSREKKTGVSERVAVSQRGVRYIDRKTG